MRQSTALPFRRLTSGPTFANVGGAVALQLTLLGSGVLSARLLGPSDRGNLAFFTVWASTLCQIGGLGISLAVTFFLARRRCTVAEALQCLRSAALTQAAVIGVLDAGIMVAYATSQGSSLLLPALISTLIVPATLAQEYGIAVALGLRRHRFASLARLVGPIGFTVALVALALSGTASLLNVTLALVCASLASGLAVLGVILWTSSTERGRGRVAAARTTTLRKDLLAFGRRGYLGYIAPSDTFRLDQIYVGLALSPRALGIYVVGAAFTNLPRMIALNLGLSGASEVASTPSDDQAAMIRRTLWITICVVTGATVALEATVGFVIPWLFGDSFRDSVPIARLLLVAGCLFSIKRVTVDLLRGLGNTHFGFRAELLALSVFAASAVPLADSLGSRGVAAAMVAGAIASLTYLLTAIPRALATPDRD